MEHPPEENRSKTCLDIFPAELWEMILDSMVEDSKNIENVLAAFPELSNVLHGRKPDWFIEQAFPNIFKQFYRIGEIEPLLALRGVSKRWCNITEQFLKNHPSSHPYNHNGINRRNISFGQLNYIEIGTPCPRWEETEIIKKRHEEMLDHPRNPFFIGRLDISNESSSSSYEPFLEASLEFLKKYGHHISHFKFSVELHEELEENLPILRKLSFTSLAPDISIYVYINQLFSLLARLEIEEMQLLSECTVVKDQNTNLSPIPSIKYFRVGGDGNHDFEFLKMFTSLEYLYLINDDIDEPTEERLGRVSNYCREDTDFSSQVRIYMNEPVLPKDVNIWEALPTVKFIGVRMGDMLWQYSRECGNKLFQIKLMDYDH